jgi:hypothetical protein
MVASVAVSSKRSTKQKHCVEYKHSGDEFDIVTLLGNNSRTHSRQANSLKNRASTARQRIIKHTSLTIEVVFSLGSVRSGCKEVFGNIEQDRTVVESRTESSWRSQSAGT